MKSLSLLFLLSLSIQTWALSPKPIPYKMQELQSKNWYEIQASLWEQQLQNSPNDGEAWWNYYLGSLYSGKSKRQLENMLAKAQSASLPSFYQALMQGIHLSPSPKALSHLQKAYELNPSDSRSYAALAIQHEQAGDASLKKQLLEQLLNSQSLYPSLLNYGYNTLMSVDENGILFTSSDNATLPLWILQEVLEVRKDIGIIPLHLLENKDYQQRILASNNLVWNGQKGIEWLAEQNPQRNFHYALTLPSQHTQEVKQHLYVVGLTSKYSNQRFDNLASIKSCLEEQFLMDYLSIDFNGEPKTATGQQLSTNYLVPMLLLEKANQLSPKHQLLAKKLLIESGNEALAVHFLKQKPAQAMPIVDFDTKDIEKAMRKVKGNVYADQAELNNMRYQQYLDFLKEQGMTDDLKKAMPDFSHYQEKEMADAMELYHSSGKEEMPFGQYPIIDISYEAAQAYCQWLTTQYNAQEGRKFNKVLFRLPSLQEWQVAALGVTSISGWDIQQGSFQAMERNAKGKKVGATQLKVGKDGILYPWFEWDCCFANKPQNEKGCYLGNFQVEGNGAECKVNTAGDGFKMTSPVAAYFANSMGLYDVVGNVAEMIAEEGKACGGSWNHSPEQSTILSVDSYSGPSGHIGFRVFMEVIEE